MQMQDYSLDKACSISMPCRQRPIWIYDAESPDLRHCSCISVLLLELTLLSNVNTDIPVTTAKSTRSMDGTDWLAKVPGWIFHMVMMNNPKGSQMTTLREKLA